MLVPVIVVPCIYVLAYQLLQILAWLLVNVMILIMIKILSSGELDKSQLIQVKNAVIKGLTEEQITNLIVNKIDADKMEEIIEIAVLENREAQ